MKKYLVALLPLLAGVALFYVFGTESRSTMKIVAVIIMLLGWYLFYYVVFHNTQKVMNTRGLLFLMSLVSLIGTVVLFEFVAYGDSVAKIKQRLGKDSPSVVTTIKNEYHQDTFYYKRQEIEAAWVYEYDIEIEGRLYNGASSFDDKVFSIGDTVRVAYYDKNPRVNTILIN